MTYAQSGEDRILRTWLRRIGARHRVAVEFGAGDGVTRSNTALLRDKGWRVVALDSQPRSALVDHVEITRDNVNTVFASYDLPADFDVLSIDVDGNDLWIWEALTYIPRVVVIEYNPRWPADVSVTVPYDPARRWDGTNYYGASVAALCRLARRKGYRLVRWTRSNLIFVQKRLVWTGLRPWHVFARPIWPKFKPPDPLQRPWVTYR